VAHVFAGGSPNRFLYSLNSMVCYYGLHYHAFVKDGKSGVWRMFDDSAVSEVRTHSTQNLHGPLPDQIDPFVIIVTSHALGACHHALSSEHSYSTT
jgi:hypothetical protein